MDEININRYYLMDEDKTYDQWQWQQPGTTWKRRGIYHITLSQSDRVAPLLGELIIHKKGVSFVDRDIIPHAALTEPEALLDAHVEPSALGRAIVGCLGKISTFHPEVELLAYQLMPDHIHAIIQVMREMPVGIRTVVRGFWQGCKKEAPDVFKEMPFIRVMSERGQLQNMIRYVHDNPRRLAMKRLYPGYMHIMRDVIIDGARMDAVGNMLLLTSASRQTVHVRRVWAEAAEKGDNMLLRNYMNGCILSARKGALSISPFISPYEKQVLERLLLEKLPIVLLQDNGFSQYYKPTGALIDACAEGRLLILAPQAYLPDKRTISRAECNALNALAEKIAGEDIKMN